MTAVTDLIDGPVREPRSAPAVGTPVLELHDVDVEIPLPHGRLHAVRGVSLTAYAGQALGLVGESGSGKSLTLRAAMDLLPSPAVITGGSVVVAGTDVTSMRPAQRREHISSTMAMIFQDALTALNPTMRIGDQVAEVPRQRLGMSRSAARARARGRGAAGGGPGPPAPHPPRPPPPGGGRPPPPPAPPSRCPPRKHPTRSVQLVGSNDGSRDGASDGLRDRLDRLTAVLNLGLPPVPRASD